MDRGATLGVWYGMAGCLLCLVLVICRLGLLRLKLLLEIKEAALGCHANAERGPFGGVDWTGRSRDMVQGPFVWTDGNLVTEEVSGKYAACAGHKCALVWF